jgi:outer membrane protein OmpA-like peptidoglycan-associated protein
MKTGLFILLLFSYLLGISQQRKQFEIYFDSGKALLNSTAFNSLDSLYKTIDISRIRSVYVYGYCDSIGNVEYNKALSIRRAETVKSYFTLKGLKGDSIILKGFGKTNPKYKSEKWDKNRRVCLELNFNKKKTVKPVAIIVKESVTKKTEVEKFIEKAEVGDKMALKNITFYGGTPEPMPESFKTLEDLVLTLKNNPTIEISIEGHICCNSSDGDDLSGRRAFAVLTYLVEKGKIDVNRLSFKGLGHTQPLTQERNAEEQQMNRRVEIRIVKK